LYDGDLFYPVGNGHNIIAQKISKKSKEIIVILTISNNGNEKEIRFLFDGNDSESSDVSEYLKGDRLFPAICLSEKKINKLQQSRSIKSKLELQKSRISSRNIKDNKIIK
jgi:hypothetical protein